MLTFRQGLALGPKLAHMAVLGPEWAPEEEEWKVRESFLVHTAGLELQCEREILYGVA